MFAPNHVGAEYGDSNNNVPTAWSSTWFSWLHGMSRAPWDTLPTAGSWRPSCRCRPVLDYLAGTSGTAPGSAPSGGGINGSDGSFRIDAAGRNTFIMPGTENLDMRISKEIPIKERFKLELLGEAFNLFSHYNATGVNSTAHSVTTSGTITDSTGATRKPAGAR